MTTIHRVFSSVPATRPDTYEIDKTVLWGRTVLSGIGAGAAGYLLTYKHPIRFAVAPILGLTAALVCYSRVLGRANITLIQRAETHLKSNDPLPPTTVAFIKNHPPLYEQMKKAQGHQQELFELALHFKDQDSLCTFLNEDKGISVTKPQLDQLANLLKYKYISIGSIDILLKYVYAKDHITENIYNLLFEISTYAVHLAKSEGRTPPPFNIFIPAIEKNCLQVVKYLLINQSWLIKLDNPTEAWNNTKNEQMIALLAPYKHLLPKPPEPVRKQPTPVQPATQAPPDLEKVKSLYFHQYYPLSSEPSDELVRSITAEHLTFIFDMVNRIKTTSDHWNHLFLFCCRLDESFVMNHPIFPQLVDKLLETWPKAGHWNRVRHAEWAGRNQIATYLKKHRLYQPR